MKSAILLSIAGYASAAVITRWETQWVKSPTLREVALVCFTTVTPSVAGSSKSPRTATLRPRDEFDHDINIEYPCADAYVVLENTRFPDPYDRGDPPFSADEILQIAACRTILKYCGATPPPQRPSKRHRILAERNHTASWDPTHSHGYDEEYIEEMEETLKEEKELLRFLNSNHNRREADAKRPERIPKKKEISAVQNRPNSFIDLLTKGLLKQIRWENRMGMVKLTYQVFGIAPPPDSILYTPALVFKPTPSDDERTQHTSAQEEDAEWMRRIQEMLRAVNLSNGTFGSFSNGTMGVEKMAEFERKYMEIMHGVGFSKSNTSSLFSHSGITNTTAPHAPRFPFRHAEQGWNSSAEAPFLNDNSNYPELLNMLDILVDLAWIETHGLDDSAAYLASPSSSPLGKQKRDVEAYRSNSDICLLRVTIENIPSAPEEDEERERQLGETLPGHRKFNTTAVDLALTERDTKTNTNAEFSPWTNSQDSDHSPPPSSSSSSTSPDTNTNPSSSPSRTNNSPTTNAPSPPQDDDTTEETGSIDVPKEEESNHNSKSKSSTYVVSVGSYGKLQVTVNANVRFENLNLVFKVEDCRGRDGKMEES